MKKIIKILPLILIIALSSGCSVLPKAVEMGELITIRTMAVDIDENKVEITVSTGQRSKGISQQPEPNLILTASGENFEMAKQALDEKANGILFYGYTDMVLLGSTSKNIYPVLENFAKDTELGINANIWAVDGNAGNLLSKGGEEGFETRLSALLGQSKNSQSAISVTVGKALQSMAKGEVFAIPMLNLSGIEGEPLTQNAYKVYEGDKEKTIIDGSMTDIANLFFKIRYKEVLDIFIEGQAVSVDVLNAETKVLSVADNGLVDLEIKIEIKPFQIDAEQSTISLIEEELKRILEIKMNVFFTNLQKVEADLFCIGEKILQKGYIKGSDKDVFKNSQLEISATINYLWQAGG